MNPATSTTPSFIYYRLIALWVLCEALLGSIIFTFRIPVSGLVIGSCAVVCISLLAWYVPAKGAIIKATLIVAIFKMMLSPQAPPPAYIAVFFQGLMGELLFWNRKYFRLFCVILALLAMVESAFQRVVSITIIYGNDFWTAVNGFLKKLTGSETLTDYSFFIIFCYVLIHLIVGMLVGVWTGFLPQRIQLMGALQKKYSVETDNITINIPVRKRKKIFRQLLFVTWILLLAIYIQSFFKIGTALLPSAMILRILIRSVIIVLTWYFLISPVLKQLLHKWLQRKKQQSAEQVQQVLNLLPSTQGLVNRSWQLAAEKKGWKRIALCCKIILANTFYSSDT
jgi:hypothetical protein